MTEKKIGRPTEALKDTTIKIRIDEQTKRMLEYCVKVSGLSKSEVIRNGIKAIYERHKGENEQ